MARNRRTGRVESCDTSMDPGSNPEAARGVRVLSAFDPAVWRAGIELVEGERRFAECYVQRRLFYQLPGTDSLSQLIMIRTTGTCVLVSRLMKE